MVLSLASARIALAAAAVALAVILPAPSRNVAAANELATAQGTIMVTAASAGQRSPACGEFVVEARDGLDNHLIARTHPASDADGACRYVLSVPAQSAVWLRLRPALVAGARVTPNGAETVGVQKAYGSNAPSGRSVALRFTIIAPTTYFFAPGEQKTVPLSY